MMKNIARTLAVAAFVALPMTALAQGQPPIGTTILSSQTVLNGTIEQDLSSKSSQPGDSFVLNVQPPFPGDDQRFQNAKIYGHVDHVTHASGTKKGSIALAFDRLELSDGTLASIAGTTLAVEEKKGGNTAGRAVAGAIVGQIVGNFLGKHIGSDIGGAVGAIGGGLYAASLGTNVTVSQGSTIKLQTSQPATVTGRRQSMGYPPNNGPQPQYTPYSNYPNATPYQNPQPQPSFRP